MYFIQISANFQKESNLMSRIVAVELLRGHERGRNWGMPCRRRGIQWLVGAKLDAAMGRRVRTGDEMGDQMGFGRPRAMETSHGVPKV